MTDDEFYARPENQAVKGRGRRRAVSKPALSAHVPVRFSQEVIAAVKALADEDGVSVSTWIRNVVAREVQRRQPPSTAWINANSVVRLTFATPASTMTKSSEVDLSLR